MLHTVAHRGPDGEGIFSHAGATVGHRRLAIIDVERGLQPIHSQDNRYTLVYNGEIYNYRALREELSSDGFRFRTESDTEVLLELLIRHKENALTRLNGMFAFAFLDHHDGSWLIARDPLGIKPLYYTQFGDQFAFASEIKALLCHDLSSRELDWEAFESYISFQLVLGDRTFFKGIKKLLPGHLLRGRANSVLECRRYWKLPTKINERSSASHFVDRLHELLHESVKLQMQADVPVGTYLSGGLDSSIVTVLAAQYASKEIQSFCGRFEEGELYDESSFARSVADTCGAQLHFETGNVEKFIRHFSSIIRALDEPVAGPGAFPQFLVSSFASQKVKVVLGGQGGDEVFGGYARYLVGYLEQALKGAIYGSSDEGKHIVTLSSMISSLPQLRRYIPLLQRFWSHGLFDDMDLRYFQLIDRSFTISSFLSADARSQFMTERPLAEFRDLFNEPEIGSYFNRMTRFDSRTLLPALLQVEDRVSMAASIESRVPLLDTRIVEFATEIPPRVKFKGGELKSLLKRATKDLVPGSVTGRTDKMGFPVPLSIWAIKDLEFRTFVRDLLLSDRARHRNLFCNEAVAAFLDSSAPDDRTLWALLSIESWHREFIDQ